MSDSAPASDDSLRTYQRWLQRAGKPFTPPRKRVARLVIQEQLSGDPFEVLPKLHRRLQNSVTRTAIIRIVAELRQAGL